MKKFTIHIVSAILLLTIVIYSTYNNNKLERNYIESVATIIDYHFNNNNYTLDYSFFVGKRKFKGFTVVSKFNCDSIPFCVGKKFKLYYYPENPDINKIDLEEYRKYQHHPPSWN